MQRGIRFAFNGGMEQAEAKLGLVTPVSTLQTTRQTRNVGRHA